MLFILFSLLQSQARLSKVVMVAAALVLIAGVSLLVYFYRRYKRIEREPEEDWELSPSSLFANVAAPSQKTEEVSTSASEASAPVPERGPAESPATIELASEVALEAGPTEPPRVEAAPPQEPAQPEPSDQPIEHRLTEMLASPSPQETAAEPKTERTTFDEELWAGLEAGEQPPIAHEHLARPGAEPPDTTRAARVEQRSHREPFEPPRIEPVLHREPFEPPRIEPLTPREQAAVTREMRSPRIPQTQRSEEDGGRDTVLFGSAAVRSSSDSLTSRAELESAAVTSVAPASRYAPAGSVLGLPAEASRKPLILGDPVRPADETGIAALSNYGKDLGPKAGRAGTIALLIVIALLGSAVASYFFVPSIHDRVSAFIARVRGVSIETNAAAMKPKAQVIPSYRPEVNKNIVKARGAVDNISDLPLENLSIEVSLQRGDGGTETRTIPVMPNPLPPNTRGSFEFEYDGKRDTGFASYTITRLLSNGTEVKFRAPPK